MRSQAQWLQLHGIDELVDEGKRYWKTHAARPDLAAIKMRSRVSEAEALLDADGLGRSPCVSGAVAADHPAPRHASSARRAAPAYPPPNLIACTISGASWWSGTLDRQPAAKGKASSYAAKQSSE